MRSRFLPFFSLFLSFALFAQTAPRVADTIIVTADRTPESLGDQTDSVTVITADQLHASQKTTVIEALREVAGISVVQSGSPGHTTSIFMRGASPAQVLVLVDGMDVNNPFFGGVDLSSMLTDGVERIEIVRGAQSPLYGSDAMAGVINIISGKHSPDSLGTLQLEAGSESARRVSLQFGTAHWSLDAGQVASKGQFANDEFRSTQVSGRVAFDLTSASSLRLHAVHDDGHAGIPFNGATPSPERNSDSTLTAAGGEYTRHVSPLVNIEARGGWTQLHGDFSDPFDAFSKRTINDATSYRATLQNLAVIGAQTITAGAEQENQDVSGSTDGVTALDETIRKTALYAQDRFERGRLTFTAGARWDRHNAFGTHLSPRISGAFALNDAWRVRAGIGSAFRAPSAGELAYPFYGNRDLKPETSRTAELGVDRNTSRASLSLTAFESKYRGLITFDPVTFIAANIDRARVRGAEASGELRIGSRWRTGAAYTHLDARDEVDERPLVRRPRNSGSVTLRYDASAWGASAVALLTGRRFEEDFSTFTFRYNPGYARFDLAAFYRLREHVRLTARVENALDREYEEVLAFPAPGRTLFAGLQLGF